MESQFTVIYVECCCDCVKHSWACVHNEQTYKNYFEQLTVTAERHSLTYKLSKNTFQSQLVAAAHLQGYNLNIPEDTQYPSIGSFEIVIQGVLLFSKLQLQRFPTTDEIESLLMCFERIRATDYGLNRLNNCKIRTVSLGDSKQLVYPNTCVCKMIENNNSSNIKDSNTLRPYTSYDQCKRMKLISHIYRMPQSDSSRPKQQTVSKLSSRNNRSSANIINLSKENELPELLLASPQHGHAKNMTQNSEEFTARQSNSVAALKRCSAPRVSSNLYSLAKGFIRRSKIGNMN